MLWDFSLSWCVTLNTFGIINKLDLDPNLKTELIGSSKVFVLDFRMQVGTLFRARAKHQQGSCL